MPWKIPAAWSFLILRIAYGIACAFDQWDINALNINANPGWVYGLGYVPVIGVLAVMCIGGTREENEDRHLIRLRRERNFKEEVEMKETRRREKEEKLGKLEMERLAEMEVREKKHADAKVFDRVIV